MAWAAVAVAVGLLDAHAEPSARVRLVVQSSALTGIRYYQAPSLWPQLATGTPLRFLREPDNPHDPNAVRVEAMGHTIGYLPRRDNAAIAWAIDRDQPLSGRISRIDSHRNGRRRIEVEVYVE